MIRRLRDLLIATDPGVLVLAAIAAAAAPVLALGFLTGTSPADVVMPVLHWLTGGAR